MEKLIIYLMLITSMFSASFDYCIDKTMQFEGVGIVDTKHEYSKFGITKQMLSKYNTKLFTKHTMNELTLIQAEHIAYEMVWKENNLHKIHNDRIASMCFDFMYNSNSTKAIKIIQTVLNDYVMKERKNNKKNLTYIKVDGVMGDKTIILLNTIPENIFASEYKVARICYLKRLSRWKMYKNGWRKRVNSL